MASCEASCSSAARSDRRAVRDREWLDRGEAGDRIRTRRPRGPRAWWTLTREWPSSASVHPVRFGRSIASAERDCRSARCLWQAESCVESRGLSIGKRHRRRDPPPRCAPCATSFVIVVRTTRASTSTAVLGVGMRRLSIIDLATGRQPIHNENKTIWIVFNGEIYNYRELRDALSDRGHSFYTSSDTEAIVHAYEEWGENAFVRLRGMFGLALWDAPTPDADSRARSRGHQAAPLRRAEAGGSIASEIKSLLAAGVVDRTIDLAALDHYLFSFLCTPKDGSIFSGIRKLPPGHLLRWHDGRAAVVPFWRVPAEESFAGSEEEAAIRLREVLADAVRAHLVSDVPLAHSSPAASTRVSSSA